MSEAALVEGEDLRNRLSELSGGWDSPDGRKLVRDFGFKDFKRAMAFANAVADLAEAAGHHPEMLIAWGRVHVTLWTHSAGGVTEKDLDLASGIDRAYGRAAH